MTDELGTSTYGFDHVGLSVRDLAGTRKFFCDCLGWRVVGERPDYPAAFVSDGRGVVTLWQVESPDKAIAFDRRANVGLHHLAVAVVDQAGLDALFKRVSSWPDVVVEFGPQALVSFCTEDHAGNDAVATVSAEALLPGAFSFRPA